MGFHVDYNDLDLLYSDLYRNVSAWNDSLSALSGNVNGLVSSANMSGNGADCVKLYFDSLHNTMIPAISRLITAHINNCLLYIRNYQSGIDTSLHAVIDEDELEGINRGLGVQLQFAEETNANVQSTLGSVSDLVSVSCPGFDAIVDQHAETKNLIETLLTDIKALEDRHEQSDFIDTSQLIAALRVLITEHLGDARSYKENFSVEAFAQSASFLALAQAYVAVNAQIEANQAAVSQAIEAENSRIEALNAEAEQRQKEANTEKLLVGICVIGAVGLIILTGGAATPFAVGAVSAASGALIAANNAAADEYVEHGWDTGKWDMGSIGTSAVLGGVSGFITGYVGAGVGKAISDGLSSAGSTLLNSSSMAVRIGSNAVIGSTSQMISGVASRGATSFVMTMLTSEGDVSTSLDAAREFATSGQQILLDAVTGGFFGGMKGIKKPTTVQPQTSADDAIPEKEFAPDVEIKQDKLNSERYYSGGDHYDEYSEFWKSGGENTHPYTPSNKSDITYVKARDIEGVYLWDNDVQNPEGFWTRWGRSGHSQESIMNKASLISEIRDKLDAGVPVEVIEADPRLKDAYGSYFGSPVEVNKVGNFYAFIEDGRHRTIAAQSLDVEIPVIIKGEYILPK